MTREYRQREQKRILELQERFGWSAVAGELDPVVLTFEVRRVYKGAVGKRQEIVIPPGARPGGPDSWPSPASLVVGVGVLAAGVVVGLGLAGFRARRRASAD